MTQTKPENWNKEFMKFIDQDNTLSKEVTPRLLFDFIKKEIINAREEGYVSRGIVEAGIKDVMIKQHMKAISTAVLEERARVVEIIHSKIGRTFMHTTPDKSYDVSWAYNQALNDLITELTQENVTN